MPDFIGRFYVTNGRISDKNSCGKISDFNDAIFAGSYNECIDFCKSHDHCYDEKNQFCLHVASKASNRIAYQHNCQMVR